MWYTNFEGIVDDYFKAFNAIDTLNMPRFAPKAKVKETETGYEIKVAVPGIDSKDLFCRD